MVSLSGPATAVVTLRTPHVPEWFTRYVYAQRLFYEGYFAGISRAQAARKGKQALPVLPPPLLSQVGTDAWVAGNCAGYEAYIEATENRSTDPAASPAGSARNN